MILICAAVIAAAMGAAAVGALHCVYNACKANRGYTAIG